MKPDASSVGVRTGIHVAQKGWHVTAERLGAVQWVEMIKDTEWNAYDDDI